MFFHVILGYCGFPLISQPVTSVVTSATQAFKSSKRPQAPGCGQTPPRLTDRANKGPGSPSCSGDSRPQTASKSSLGYLVYDYRVISLILVGGIPTPLKNISQLG